MMWRRTRIPGLLIVVSVVGYCVFIQWREYRLITGFNQIDTGSSLREVRRQMGRPERETDGTMWVYGGNKLPSELVPGCVRELWYVCFWVPSRYALCFDANEKLISKYNYVSP
jgi:hypothetical protein